MSSRPLEEERPHAYEVPVGNTRPAMPYGFPFYLLPIVIVLPIALVLLEKNPVWLILMVPLGAIARSVVVKDPNRPRVLLLWFLSGSAFADRRLLGAEGVEVIFPTPPPDRWLGISHD